MSLKNYGRYVDKKYKKGQFQYVICLIYQNPLQ